MALTKVSAQDKKFVTINTTIPIHNIKVMDIKDSVLIQKIDFCVHNEYQCKISEGKNYIYALSITYGNDNDFIIYATFTSPSILKNSPNAGIFEYNKSIYSVAGDAVCHFFSETEKRETLFYNMDYVYSEEAIDEFECVKMCPLIGIEEYCIWDFSFKNNELKLIRTAWTEPVTEDSANKE
jgi:hypothetical protein